MIKIKSTAIQPSFFPLITLFCILLLAACNNDRRNNTHQGVSLSSIRNGEALAKVYCQSCHMLPGPSLLDTKSWEKGVLPQMGPRLGIFYYGNQEYPRLRDMSNKNDFYPSKPLLNSVEWQNIIDYFVATSPDSLSAQNRKDSIKTGLSLFQVQMPDIHYASPATCYVKINSGDSLHPLIISDAIRQKIYFVSPELTIKDSVVTRGPVVDIEINKNNLLACNIGVLNPNNGRYGKVEMININPKGEVQIDTTAILDSLQRPVQVATVDLDNNGRKDYLICEFGYFTGALIWMENSGNVHFKRHVLRDVPGAIKVYVEDYNHDGLPDIWALFSQGEEGIFLFTNKGKGNFQQEEVLRFPSAYGSSWFELVDFDKDGYPDIVYTCGDNADYSPVLKPYHGVYIFMNDKTNHFTQKFFFPINGCYKSITRDYDGDGNPDIATISFFADYEHQPEESFVYLKNTGNFEFRPYTIPGTNLGRWLTMDAGDIDGDGKTDILLGNFSIKEVKMKHKVDWKLSPPFIILKNIGK